MSISIGAITLSNDLVWKNEFESPSIGQSVMTTIGGENVVHTDPLSGGREIVLSAERRNNAIYGYYTRQHILDIQAYEQSGNTVTFVYGSQSLTVKIKAGGIKVEPLMPVVDQGYSDYYIGTVTLIEV